MQAPQPNHVAILVPSVKRAASALARYGFAIGPEEEWQSEGTREIYVERGKRNSLLLIEPARPGAYQRAIEKRGAGLHHLAITVPNLQDYLSSITASGWLLHLQSLEIMKKLPVAYLARPGFPGLIEVEEGSSSDQPLFVDGIGLRLQEASGLLTAVGLQEIVRETEGESWISCSGHRIPLSVLF